MNMLVSARVPVHDLMRARVVSELPVHTCGTHNLQASNVRVQRLMCETHMYCGSGVTLIGCGHSRPPRAQMNFGLLHYTVPVD